MEPSYATLMQLEHERTRRDLDWFEASDNLRRRIGNLSRCLRDAGALCAAFVSGARRCSCDGSWDVQAVAAIGCHLYPGAWFPGCGAPAPESP